MNRSEIIEKLTAIFRTVFNNPSIVLTNEITASDIDGWDSLSHMLLISEIEKILSIKFKLKELNKMKNVGEMIDVISTKL